MLVLGWTKISSFPPSSLNYYYYYYYCNILLNCCFKEAFQFMSTLTIVLVVDSSQLLSYSTKLKTLWIERFQDYPGNKVESGTDSLIHIFWIIPHCWWSLRNCFQFFPARNIFRQPLNEELHPVVFTV